MADNQRDTDFRNTAMNAMRVLRYALVIQTVWLIIGCCSDHHIITYQWSGMELTHLDNSGADPLETDGRPIAATAYGIRMTLRDSSLITGIRFSPLPAAYATSCYEVFTYINRDTVLDITIHSLENGAANDPRDVTGDFIVLPMYHTASTSSFSDEFISIPRMVQRLNEMPTPFQRVNFIRVRNMERQSDVRFIVTMQLTGGKTFIDTTSLVTLI